jgi:hypothetical protein
VGLVGLVGLHSCNISYVATVPCMPVAARAVQLMGCYDTTTKAMTPFEGYELSHAMIAYEPKGRAQHWCLQATTETFTLPGRGHACRDDEAFRDERCVLPCKHLGSSQFSHSPRRHVIGDMSIGVGSGVIVKKDMYYVIKVHSTVLYYTMDTI